MFEDVASKKRKQGFKNVCIFDCTALLSNAVQYAFFDWPITDAGYSTFTAYCILFSSFQLFTLKHCLNMMHLRVNLNSTILLLITHHHLFASAVFMS